MNNKGELVIDFRELGELVRKYFMIIMLTGIMTGLCAFLLVKCFVAPTFESTTKMYVLNRQDRSLVTSQDMQISESLTRDYVELIQSRTVIENVITQMKLGISYEKMLKRLEISTREDTRIISITVEDTDPYMAKDIADRIREVSAEHIKAVMDIATVNVVEDANIPQRATGPNLKKAMMFGGVLGVLLSVAIILLCYFLNDTVKTAEDVERYLGLNVLGEVIEETRRRRA